ncbi:MAG: hypothetical protein N5P05_002664 [Chroococcopsis gigantea SAG 12.99]|jgi:hypothetical protein|nr:hypothetical protein [Chlorogloea purpurea SAG 13.99]MDV3001058.1 hypothetical protein [Chroococcopsis gigantea SAG 12.99]
MNRLTVDGQRETIQDSNFIPLKHSVDKELPRLTAREFCRKMYGLSGLPEIEILRAEMNPSYRKRCVGLLSKALGRKRQSVRNWGPGVDFPKMPAIYERFLGVCWELYELQSEVKRLRRFTA